MFTKKTEGRAALLTGIGLALFAPLFTVVLPTAGLEADDFTNSAHLDAFVRDHFPVFALPYLDGLLLHLAGLVLVLAIHQRIAHRSPWVLAATIGGVAWMVLDTAQNGTGIYAALEITRHAGPDVSGPQLVLLGQLLTGLRLAGHVFGGLWILLISAVGVRHGGLAQGVARLGLLVGGLMTLNVLAPVTQFPLFVLLPVWFIWLAVTALRSSEEDPSFEATITAEPAMVGR